MPANYIFSEAALIEFNKVGKPPEYKFEGIRQRSLNEVYNLLFSRAVFNKTGDTKIQNKQISQVLKNKGIIVSDRQVRRIIEKLRRIGHIKTFEILYKTGAGPRTERYIRIPAAHARLNYTYEKREKVFSQRYKQGFNPQALNYIKLLDSNLKFESEVRMSEYPIIPYQFQGCDDILTDEYVQACFIPLDVTDKGMDDLDKYKAGMMPGGALDEYNQLVEGWDYGDSYAIMALGSQSGWAKAQRRIKAGNVRSDDEFISSN